MARRSLSRLLSPQSIAVVGGQRAATVLEKCQSIGFAGALYAVHPTHRELAGIPCVKELGDLPETPDACFIGVSPQRTIEVVEQLAGNEAGGAVCYASGFAEAGGAGEQLQRALVESAGTMPFVGPNCHGFINYLDGAALWPDHFGGGRTDKGPALLMQSGNIGINVTFQQRELALSYVVAMGNNAQLNVHDYIHALLDDPRVTAIGLHLEGISDVPAFTVAALRALKQRVPLVALKSGSSELGAKMALSHTRSLANPDDLISVMFERYGVARCSSLPELLETLKFVSTGGAIVPQGDSDADQPRIASMSCSGGEASHLADLAARCELTFPELSAETSRSLSDVLGDRVHVSNPLDYHTYAWGDEPLLTRAFTYLLREPLDCALLVLDYPPPERYDVESWHAAERALMAASRTTGTRVVIVSSLPENFPACARARLRALGVAPMQGMRECVLAIRHAATIGRAWQASDTLSSIDVPLVTEGPVRVLDEYDSKQELVACGLIVPPAKRGSVSEARELASSVGLPVVLKALGADLAHKTELGAVRVNISTLDHVRRHAEELGHLSNELLVEAMVDDVVAELFVGVTSDPDFGQVLVLGAGGVNVELTRDTVQLLLPASRAQIGTAVRSLTISRQLDGFRGGDPGDVDAALDAIMAICAYASANRDSLLELDVNPLIVRSMRDRRSQSQGRSQERVALVGSAHGHSGMSAGAVAVDALIRKRSQEDDRGAN